MSQEFTPKEPRFVDSKAPFLMLPPEDDPADSEIGC